MTTAKPSTKPGAKPDIKPTLFLVHGIGDTARVFNPMVAYLRDRGWTAIHAINLQPNNGDVGLDRLAQQVQASIEAVSPEGTPVDLVGFSMGGIVSRYYVQRLGGAERIQRLITISSPHNGTWMGYFRHNPGACQMRPQSAFLQDLNASVVELAQVDFTSIWTPYDLMIVPARSSCLPVGTMQQFPVLAHPLMLTNQRVLGAVATALSPPATGQT